MGAITVVVLENPFKITNEMSQALVVGITPVFINVSQDCSVIDFSYRFIGLRKTRFPRADHNNWNISVIQYCHGAFKKNTYFSVVSCVRLFNNRAYLLCVELVPYITT